MSTTPTDPTGMPQGAGPEQPYAGARTDQTGAQTGTRTGPRVTGDEARDLGRLRRSRADRRIAGVAGGLAHHLDIDPVILRVAFVVAIFFGGAGLLLYGAAWLFVPEEDTGSAVVDLDPRSRAFVLYLAAGIAVVALLGDAVGGIELPWPLLVIGLVVTVLLSRRDRSGSSGTQRWGEWRGWAGHDTRQQTGSGTTAAPVGDPAAPADAGPEGTVRVDLSKGTSRTPGPVPETGWAPWSPPPTGQAPLDVRSYVRPRNPRKRGPVLFWFTLALIALLEGALGLLDAAGGVQVADPAYAALALAVTGAMLLLSAFWGRGGGLVLVGLIATGALVLSTAAQEWHVTDSSERIHLRDVTQLQSSYAFGLGEYVIDLSDLDPVALAGRSLAVTGDVGRIEVELPPGLAATATATVEGPGHASVLDQEQGGVDTRLSNATATPVTAGRQPFHVVAELGVGEIEIKVED